MRIPARGATRDAYVCSTVESKGLSQPYYANRLPRKSVPTITNILGDRIQIKRFEKGLLQTELATKLGVFVELLKVWDEDVRKLQAKKHP
jgi:DNA-binding transcriptional regulator YiaG